MPSTHRSAACSLLPRLAAAILLVSPLTACLPKTKPPATLISPRELGMHELGVKVTLPDEAAAYDGKLSTSSWVKTGLNGRVDVDFRVDQAWGTLTLAPTSATQTVEEAIEEAEHSAKDYKLIDQGQVGDAGWFLMYSAYVPAHVYKDAYGEQQFVNSEQLHKLVSRVKAGDTWFTCTASTANVTLVRAAAKICGSAEPWAPQPAAAPKT